MTPLAVAISTAVIFGATGLVAVAVCTRPERRRRPLLDQGPRGDHLGWFEARSARWLRRDVIFGVIVTPDRVLLADAGTTSGPADTRRERFARELSSTSTEVLVARRPHGTALPLADIRRATFRKVSWWYRGAPPGPALLAIERSGHPRLELLLDDETQLTACAAALAPVLGAAFDIPPALAREIRTPDAARTVAVLRQRERFAMLAIALPASISVLTAGIAVWESMHPPRAVTARVIDCIERRGKRSASLVLKLDGPPGQVEWSPGTYDVSSDLQEVCARRSTVHAVYRTALSGRHWIDAISLQDGKHILPTWVAEERKEQVQRGLAGMIGASAAIAASGACALTRLRRRVRSLGA